MLYPFSSFFLITLLIGMILSLSASSWFAAWVGLELNLLSFIPIISIKSNPYSSESAIKYFLIQTLGSTFLFMASCLLLTSQSLSTLIIVTALLLKLGSAPFHFWFPQVMEGLKWPQAFILISIQKLAPMILISYILINNHIYKIIILSSILSAIVGALGGLNSLQLRKIMAFSSINHISWMFMGLIMNNLYWLMYFFFYTFISASVISLFHLLNTFNMTDMLKSNPNSLLLLTLSFSLLSLGGLPPFTGFVPKWIMVQVLSMNFMIIPLFFLLLSTLITLYFYLRIIIPLILLYTPITSQTMMSSLYPTHQPMFLLMFFFFNFIGLILPIPFILL